MDVPLDWLVELVLRLLYECNIVSASEKLHSLVIYYAHILSLQ